MTYLAGQQFVDVRKITGYLLNLHHADGRSKAKFFLEFGFDTGRPEELVNALALHPSHNTVVSSIVGPFGEKSVVECRIETPDGRGPCIRTVWIREGGSGPHRLVTAVPRA